ncbi:hypothetical protein ADUPG1_007642, partial [Aduncisulcus paluster]
TDPASAAAAPVWARYLIDWTFWNHVRTVTSLAATAILNVLRLRYDPGTKTTSFIAE